MIDKALLYVNTIKPLKSVQIRYQLKKRLMKKIRHSQFESREAPAGNKAVKVLIESLDMDQEYLDRFCGEKLLKNHVTLLNETFEVENRWYVDKASHLWNYNLHYLEFLIPLAVNAYEYNSAEHYGKWKWYMTSWLQNKSYDSYEPYTVSLRIVNILICTTLLRGYLENDRELEYAVNKSIYNQYCFLIKHQELDLLANHYFENLKAIVIGSLFFGEDKIFKIYYKKFIGQLKEQILSDGVHYERSLMYHKIILEDVLRVYSVLKSLNMGKYADELRLYIEKMAMAMECLESGFPRTPLFNDAGDNVAKAHSRLLETAEILLEKKICQSARKDFNEAGYYRLDHGKAAVLFDCGVPGPEYMSGHAQNDALSFELAIDNQMVFVNSGTGLYQGKKRTYYRSTRAHNTFMIDNREQSQLWGEHRAAKRMHPVAVKRDEDKLCGKYMSYGKDCFERCMYWEGNVLIVKDRVKANDRRNHTFKEYWHLSPGLRYEEKDNIIYVYEKQTMIARIRLNDSVRKMIYRRGEICFYAENFGEDLRKEVLILEKTFHGETVNTIKIDFTGVC